MFRQFMMDVTYINVFVELGYVTKMAVGGWTRRVMVSTNDEELYIPPSIYALLLPAFHEASVCSQNVRVTARPS
jgi:hypothetical protein